MLNLREGEHERTRSTPAETKGVRIHLLLLSENFSSHQFSFSIDVGWEWAALSLLASSHYDTEQKQDTQKPRQAKALKLIHSTCFKRHWACIGFADED